MQASRRTLRLIVIALLGLSLTACHFHRHGCGPRYHVPVRFCR